MSEARTPPRSSVTAEDVAAPSAAESSRDDFPRLLIVEDDPLLARVLSRYLQRHGFETDWVSEGQSVIAAVEMRRPDLVLLDVMLPGRHGHHVCRDLRAQGDLPVLMLTALADEDARVAGLEAGADDYVCKPFSPRELVLRIRSLLRRTGGNASLPELLRDSELSVDLRRREAHLGERVLSLTAREHDLLQFLMQHPGVNFTRQELLERVWGWTHGDLSTVTVHVRRLREKIEEDPTRPGRLLTVFGVGYRYEYGEQR